MGIEKIANKYKKEGDNQPSEIWTNTELDEFGRKECLCANCDRKNDKPMYSSCPTAGKLYKVCAENSMALAIRKCGTVDENGDLMYKPLK